MDQNDLIYEKPPERWLDGVPLGNGRIGAMIWGDGDPLHINLDTYYAWETREVPTDPDHFNFNNLKRLLVEKKQDEIDRIFFPRKPVNPDDPQRPHPTRLPMPRMNVRGLTFNQGRLRLETATWEANAWSAIVHADKELFVLKSDSPISVEFDYSSDVIKDRLKLWGYPPMEFEEVDGVNVCRQRMPEQRGEFIIAWTQRDGMLLVTIRTTFQSNTPLDDATTILNDAGDWNDLTTRHNAWWKTFWEASSVSVPDAMIETLYYVEMYKLGSSVRPDGLAITLQGLWTTDGVMPPWAGGYHLDTNIQECYWPVYASNHLDLGLSLCETFYRMLPKFKQNCREFFGIEGGWSGCSISFNGGRTFGWVSTEFSPGNLAWLSHNLWWQHKYGGDLRLLEESIRPIMKAAWQVYRHLLKEKDDGKLHLDWSYSPEWHGGSLDAWLKDSNYDAALIRFLCRALIEADDALGGGDPDRSEYETILEKLYDYPGDDDFWVAQDTPLTHSHRHHSHLMAIYPLGVVSMEGGDEEKKLIENSLRHIRGEGTGGWCGYSFPWMSMIAARAGEANMAWNTLTQYKFLIAPNTMHTNGDPRHFGVAWNDYDPMTVEAGCGFAAAVMEMLLQSWNGLIRVFPAVPDFWPDVSFTTLLAEGGTEVSAERRGGETAKVELTSKRDGVLRMKNPFKNGFDVSGGELIASGDVLEIRCKAGQTVTLTSQTPQPKTPKIRSDGEKNIFGLKKIPRF